MRAGSFQVAVFACLAWSFPARGDTLPSGAVPTAMRDGAFAGMALPLASLVSLERMAEIPVSPARTGFFVTGYPASATGVDPDDALLPSHPDGRHHAASGVRTDGTTDSPGLTLLGTTLAGVGLLAMRRFGEKV